MLGNSLPLQHWFSLSLSFQYLACQAIQIYNTEFNINRTMFLMLTRWEKVYIWHTGARLNWIFAYLELYDKIFNSTRTLSSLMNFLYQTGFQVQKSEIFSIWVSDWPPVLCPGLLFAAWYSPIEELQIRGLKCSTCGHNANIWIMTSGIFIKK